MSSPQGYPQASRHECQPPAIDPSNLPRGAASWTCPEDGARYTLVKRWYQERPIAYWQRLPDYMQPALAKPTAPERDHHAAEQAHRDDLARDVARLWLEGVRTREDIECFDGELSAALDRLAAAYDFNAES